MAAGIYLQGIDPIGVPWLRADVLGREVWVAVVSQAAEIAKGAK